MTFIEKLFLCVLYGMYLYDCVYWLAPDEVGHRRTSQEAWQPTRRSALSFTLLGRVPVLSSPLLMLPGFVRQRGDAAGTERLLRKVGKRLNTLIALQTLCRLQAFTLLVYLPVLLVLHRLSPLWPVFVAMLLTMHATLCVLAILALRAAKPEAWLTPASSLVLNPLGATRALDVVAQAFFDQPIKARPKPQPATRKTRKP